MRSYCGALLGRIWQAASVETEAAKLERIADEVRDLVGFVRAQAAGWRREG